MSGRTKSAQGTAIYDPTSHIFYGVLIIFGEPVLIHTKFINEAIIYTDRELPIAEEALKKSGVTRLKRMPITEIHMHSLIDWQV